MTLRVKHRSAARLVHCQSAMKPTATAVALELAAQARTDPQARLHLPLAVDLAWLELVRHGAIQAADQVVGRCLLLANRDHLSTCRTFVREHSG